MSLVQQFLKGFRQTDTLEPGLFEKNDGTVWLRNTDGSETQVAGGSQSSFPEATSQFSVANGYLDGQLRYVFQADPVGLTGGFGQFITTVPMVVAPSGIVVSLSSALLAVTGLPVSIDGFDLAAQIIISDLTGAQILRVGPILTVIAAGVASGSIDLTGASHTPTAGTDLVFENIGDAINVTSTAGGIYAFNLILSGAYD